MSNNNHYFYTVYRNSDDKLIVLDAHPAEAIRLMKVKPNTFYRILSLFGGRNRMWTIIKTDRKEIEEQMNG